VGAAKEEENDPSRARVKWMIPAAVVLTLAVIFGSLYMRKHPTVQLTDKDQLILADFTNQTGDTVFDSTLKEALAIQLEQSPCCNWSAIRNCTAICNISASRAIRKLLRNWRSNWASAWA
jgi:hypothetical protein